MSRKQYERCISYDTQRNVYYLYLDFGKDDSGQRVRQYRTYRTLTQARQARNAHLLQRAQACDPLPSVLTLGEWLEEWMEMIVIPNRAETTVYSYWKIIHNHLIPALGSIPLQKLSPKDIQSYYVERMHREHLSANTIHHHHDLLSAALRAALRQDLIARSPMERVEPPRFIPKEAHFYSSEELKELYHLVENHRLEVPVRLAGSLGLRREEICGLRWESVDFDLRRIHIRAARTAAGTRIIEKETKNHSSMRVLHMGDDIFQLLRKEQQRQDTLRAALGDKWPDCGMVAVNAKGEPLSPNGLSCAFTRFIRAHPELPPLTFHGLRHTFATVASAQGVPLFDIGKTLGHSTPATTGRIYTHLVDRFHTDTLDKVAEALK